MPSDPDPSSPVPAHERALADPASFFASPEDVVADEQLSDEQKIEVLRRWAYDADEEAVAGEEGMPGEGSPVLEQILVALEQLGVDVDTEHTPPTKQGGLTSFATKHREGPVSARRSRDET